MDLIFIYTNDKVNDLIQRNTVFTNIYDRGEAILKKR